MPIILSLTSKTLHRPVYARSGKGKFVKELNEVIRIWIKLILETIIDQGGKKGTHQGLPQRSTGIGKKGTDTLGLLDITGQ